MATASRTFTKSIGSHQTDPLLEGWLGKLEACRTDIAGFAKYWSALDEFRAARNGFLTNFDVLPRPCLSAQQCRTEHPSSTTSSPASSYTMTHNLTGWPAAAAWLRHIARRDYQLEYRSPPRPGVKTSRWP